MAQVAFVVALCISLFATGAFKPAPDHYAPCARLSTPKEQNQCKNLVAFALSAGW